MRTLRSISELHAALARPRREGCRIGLVPTMGAFHEGHLSLIRRARIECDDVVVSLFVNPAQFNEAADLSAYPRDGDHDALLAAEERVDFLFAPGVEEIYPSGFATNHQRRRLTTSWRVPVAAAATSTESRPLSPNCSHRQPRRRVLRPEGRSAGTGDQAPGPRPQPAGPDRDLPDRTRAGRPCDVEPQRTAGAGRARAGDGAERSLRVAAALVAAGETNVRTILDATRAELRRRTSADRIPPDRKSRHAAADDHARRARACAGRRAHRQHAPDRQPPLSTATGAAPHGNAQAAGSI